MDSIVDCQSPIVFSPLVLGTGASRRDYRGAVRRGPFGPGDGGFTLPEVRKKANLGKWSIFLLTRSQRPGTRAEVKLAIVTDASFTAYYLSTVPGQVPDA